MMEGKKGKRKKKRIKVTPSFGIEASRKWEVDKLTLRRNSQRTKGS